MDNPAGHAAHPLVSLLAALVRAAVYLLHLVRHLAGLALTLPFTVSRVFAALLGWSWTLRLDFPVVAFLGCLVPAGIFVLVRYKFLNKYTELKEAPLSKPGKKSLHPDVLSDSTSIPLHNYLDEFLSAIRIFGFLEKPVFHELSRHLQTRRLIAGDTLSLDPADKSFYCVVDGHVQVFAPSPPAPYSHSPLGGTCGDDDPPLNGYDLLTEVSSGGTLSSLFTILSLFTEDVRLSWDDPSPPSAISTAAIPEVSTPSDRRPRRANSDVSAFDLAQRDGDELDDEGAPSESATATPGLRGWVGLEDEDARRAGYSSGANSSGMASRSSSYSGGGGRGAHSARGGNQEARFTGGGARGEERGSLARATVDTTLAVIPAEAFRRLTRKFPKASAHIVQVILTRFSRVTFTTAHQYLGLTSEVLGAESTLNELVSHPLPAEFYEGGGMERLRERFRPETKATRGGETSSEDEDDLVYPARSPLSTREREPSDYFNFDRSLYEGSGPTGGGSSSSASSRRRGSLSSGGGKTPRLPTPAAASAGMPKLQPMTPATVMSASPRSFHQPIPPISRNSFAYMSSSAISGIGAPSPIKGRDARPGDLSSSPTAQQQQKSRSPHPPPSQAMPVLRRSSTRRQVQAGDLLSMTTREDETSYRPGLFRPVTPRPTRWGGESGGHSGSSQLGGLSHANRGILPTRRSDTTAARSSHASIMAPLGVNGSSSMAEFNLRDAVMASLAKSIGLIQPPKPPPISSHASSNISPLLASVSRAGSISGSPGSSTPLGAFGHGGRNGGGGAPYPYAQGHSGMGGLSLLDRGSAFGGDDESSSTMTGHSSNTGWALADGQQELENEVEILFFPKGSTLVKAGEKHAGLFYVIDGFLEVVIPPPEADKKARKAAADFTAAASSEPTPRRSSSPYKHMGSASMRSGRSGAASAASTSAPVVPVPGSTPLYTVKPGGIAGYLSALSNSASYVDLITKTDAYVGFLPADALERLLERRPIVLLTLAKRLISLLSPLMLHIDASLDWMQLDAGQVLYRQGEPSDSIYIVINGRLRAIQETEGGTVETIAEHGQGESVGELDVIMTVPRGNTVHAIRDTEVARMPLTLFNAISIRHPATTIKFLRLIASRVTKEVNVRSQRAAPPPGALELTPSNLNLKTIAILPSSKSVPVAAFAKKLRAALEAIGAPTAYLDQTSVMRHLGRHTFSTMGKLKVAGWLAEQEQQYRMVLYVADTAVSSQWTVTCIRQADYVMVVGMGDDPSLGEYEQLLLAKKTTARKELVLLHPDRTVPSGSTRPWLKERPWISQHHHVELPGLVVSTKPTHAAHDPKAVVAFKHLREKVQTQIKRFRGLQPHRVRTSPQMSDFARLARRLCGASIGVVLGGGGGRGISHIGFLQALEDEGVPIDMIGGCSIGAFVGGLYAKDGNLLGTTARTKQFSGRMASVWRLLSDVTFPTISYTTGHEFNRGIFKAFDDVHLEDLWLPFFCNSTSLNWSRMEIHTTGYAWRAVRASMTLAGLLPPLSENGNMLVDGGYIDNLPVSTMTSMGASRIFAIDVGGVDDPSPRNYGDSVSGFWVLLNRYNPFSDARLIPTLTEVTSRLTYVSSIKSLEEAKATPGVLYQAMPVQAYTTMGGFSSFDEIHKIGVEAGTAQLHAWRAEGRLPTGFLDGTKARVTRAKGSVRLRRNSI